LAQRQEYIMQRPNTEFWLGLCAGRGVQLYVPQITRILQGVFYAYRYPGLNDVRAEIAASKKNNKPVKWEPTDDLFDEDNVGEWEEPESDFIITPAMLEPGIMVRPYGMEDLIQEEIVPTVVPGYGMGDITEGQE